MMTPLFPLFPPKTEILLSPHFRKIPQKKVGTVGTIQYWSNVPTLFLPLVDREG